MSSASTRPTATTGPWATSTSGAPVSSRAAIPQASYARTWASQTPHAASGFATGPTVIAAPDSTTSPLKIHGPGSNLADSTVLELTANGELILSGGSGNGYRFAELGAANNPSGWSGALKVKTPDGTTLGYLLLYSNP